MNITTKMFGFGVLGFLLLSLTGYRLLPDTTKDTTTHLFMTAAAEDDEDEYENENDDDAPSPSASSSKASSKPKTIKVIKEVIEYKPVTETIYVTEAAYAIDTDGDVLVDALDPDPLIPQSEYFTDIDGDGMPNALDRYHDEDDFAYYEFETDDNGNGILDSYEH